MALAAPGLAAVAPPADAADAAAFLTIRKAELEATRGPWVFDHPFFLILQ